MKQYAIISISVLNSVSEELKNIILNNCCYFDEEDHLRKSNDGTLMILNSEQFDSEDIAAVSGTIYTLEEIRTYLNDNAGDWEQETV